MNLPTLIILALVVAAVVLAIWLPRRHGRKITDCGCGSSTSCTSCRGCALAEHCRSRQ